MTCKILHWLRKNQTNLQDIDYADGIDICGVKELVYHAPIMHNALKTSTLVDFSSQHQSIAGDELVDSGVADKSENTETSFDVSLEEYGKIFDVHNVLMCFPCLQDQ